MTSEKESIRNFSIGILGHVDSGKTSLAKVLSTKSSTAAFDKSPQSQDRGITLDVGFSSFEIVSDGDKKVEITIVDCPGHASLVRTVIGGSQIIDAAILVIDINKGIQTQTAECLVLAEITERPLIIVLNKIDLLPLDKRADRIKKVTKNLQKTLKDAGYSDCEIVPISTVVTESGFWGKDELVNAIEKSYRKSLSVDNDRKSLDSKMCLMSFDHCFALRGQGTVLTGTMLQGKLAVGDVVEILPIKLERKVKSIQRFKAPVDSISSGDRAGVCVTKIDASDLERGLLVSPPGGGGTVTLSSGCIIEISQVRFYKGEIRSHSNFHISIGYETTVGKVTLFGAPKSAPKPTADDFFRYEFEAIDAISSTNPQNIKKAGQYDDKPPKYTSESYYTYAMIEWKTDMYIPNSSLIIGSKLDSDPSLNVCRLAFYGRVFKPIHGKHSPGFIQQGISLFTVKHKSAEIFRVIDDTLLIAKGSINSTNIPFYDGFRVDLIEVSSGEVLCTGTISGLFGKSDKFRVQFPTSANLSLYLGQSKKTKAPQQQQQKQKSPQCMLLIKYRKFLNSALAHKKIDQKFTS